MTFSLYGKQLIAASNVTTNLSSPCIVVSVYYPVIPHIDESTIIALSWPLTINCSTFW